jgi:hypothetical protein
LCLKKVYLHQSLIRYIDIILNVKYLKNLGEPKYLDALEMTHGLGKHFISG